MKSYKNKINAEKNKAVGAIKENVGKMIGNIKLEQEGSTKRAKGHIQSAVENVKDAARNAMK